MDLVDALLIASGDEVLGAILVASEKHGNHKTFLRDATGSGDYADQNS